MPKGTMIKDFRFTPPVQKSRSQFDLSKRRCFTMDSAHLIPAYVKKVYPGDTFNLSCRHQTRMLSPLKYPIMDNLKVEMHYYFCDERVLFPRFTEFIGEQLVPGVSSSVTLPTIAIGAYEEGVLDERVPTHSICDYLGIPASQAGFGPAGVAIRAEIFRLYNQIYNWYYRDQDVTTMAPVYTDGGVTIGEQDVYTVYPLRRRQKRKDYFTSCRPWPQKGPDVLLPMAESAPVFGNGYGVAFVNQTKTDADDFIYATAEADFQTGVSVNPDRLTGSDGVSLPNVNDGAVLGVASAAQIAYRQTHGVPNASTGLYADLSQSVAGTINELRNAWAMQMILETDMLYGSRYPERVYGHFGVTVADPAYKPDYLGGGIDFIQNVPVVQTSQNDTQAGQYLGKVTSFGIGSGNLGGFTYTSETDGWIMAILSIVPDITYSQGIPRDFLNGDRFDEYVPELANLGEQPVYNIELYASSVPTQHMATFGYQEPWAHLRFDFSDFAGLMRHPYHVSDGETSLDAWHLGQDLHDELAFPVLNTAFLEYWPSVVDRVVQIPSQPQFLVDLYFSVTAARVLPAFPSRSRLGGI